MSINLVSSQSETQAEQNRLRETIQYQLKELAANLMRMTAGGGKPHNVCADVLEACNAILEYKQKTSHLPTGDLYNCLLPVPYEFSQDGGTKKDIEWRMQEFSMQRALESIIDASLQYAASRMLGQRTQERLAETKIYDGIKRLEEARNGYRRKYDGVHPNITTEKFPRQGDALYRFVRVCFHYGATEFEALCIRDDYEHPFLSLFLLSDGRVVQATECQYAKLAEENVKSTMLLAVKAVLENLHPALKLEMEQAQ